MCRVAPLRADAQWSSTAIGVAEFDTESAMLLLGGVSAGPSGLGLKPRVGVQAYLLRFDGGGSAGARLRR